MMQSNVNGRILQAYRKMLCEAANTDGTIDDRSRYDDILRDCAERIFDRCVEAANRLSRSYISDDGKIDDYRNTLRLHWYGLTFELSNAENRYFPYSSYNGRKKYNEVQVDDDLAKWVGIAERRRDELIEKTYNLLKSNGGLVQIKRETDYYHAYYDELNYRLTQEITIDTFMGVSIIVHPGVVGYEGKDGESTFNRKARRGKSAAFRKNLPSPNFPDRQRDSY